MSHSNYFAMLPNNALFMQICMHMSRVCMITVTATCPMGYLIKPVFALFIYPILPCIQKHTFTHVYMLFFPFCLWARKKWK